jgi:hypothetical protein
LSRVHRILAAALLVLTGCGYSNALYNARRQVSDAERAAPGGAAVAATDAYVRVLDGAAAVYRRDPNGRDAGEALFLVGWARFGLGEHAAALAALRRSLERPARPDVHAAARAYLGAAALELGQPHTAAAVLDSAIAELAASTLSARAHLWRARARIALGHAGARDDLDRAEAAGGALAREARLHAAALAIAASDSVRAAEAFHALLEDAGTERSDSLADAARLLAARWRLHGLDDPAQLADIRTLLLPASPTESVHALLEALRVLGALLDAADEQGHALALFAAAELARDDLDAPALARTLLLAYAERAPASVWAPKALLAAATLGGPDDAILAAIEGAADNVYVAATRGPVDAAAFAAAETQLARELAAIRGEAATAVADSVGLARRVVTDTLRVPHP